MADDYSDLLSKWLPSSSEKTTTAKGKTEYDDLIEKFGGNEITPEVKTAPVAAVPAKIAPPQSGYSKEESDAMNARPSAPVVARSTNRLANAISEVPGELGQGVVNLPGEYAKNVGKHIGEAKDLGGEGVTDISQNKPWTGLGKTGLATLIGAVSPITGATDLIEKGATNLTGNKEFGELAGFVGGSAIPVGKAGSSLKAALPSNKAISALVDSIGIENLPTVIDRLKSNPRLSVYDVSPQTLQMAQKLVVTEGKHQNPLIKSVEGRVGEDTKQSVLGAYNDVMGVPVNVVEKLKTMKQAARDVGSKEINPAVKGAGPVDLTPVIENIDAKLKPGVMSKISMGDELPSIEVKKELAQIKSMLTDGKSVRTNADELHKLQSNLRSTADGLIHSADGQSKRTGYALMNVRNQIVDAIDAASPKIKDAKGNEIGTYKDSLGRFADEKQIDEAFRKGTTILENSQGAKFDTRPEFWEEWKKNAKPAQIDAAKEGIRIAVDNKIRGMRNTTGQKGTEIPQTEFNVDKLKLFFDKDEVNKLTRRLNDERDITNSKTKLLDNSQTAMRLKADSRVDLPVEKQAGLGALLAPIAELGVAASTGVSGAGLLMGAGLGAKKLAYKSSLGMAKKKNEELTKLITSTGPDRDELIKTLSQYIPQGKLTMAQRLKLATGP